MKSALPWVIIVVLLGGVYFLYTANKAKEAELARLSQDAQELDKLRAENEELKKLPAQNEELTRLRKDNEDLLRLRNEAQRLRDQAKQLSAQLASAQDQNSQVQQVQQRLASENQNLRSQTQQAQEIQTAVQQQMDACIVNLRMIDGAKQQWALENKKTAADVPTAADLAPFFTNQIVCPGGGTYTINAVGVPPACTVPGHTLAK